MSQGLLFDWEFYKDDPGLPVAGGMNLPLEVTLRTSAYRPTPVSESGEGNRDADFPNSMTSRTSRSEDLSAKLSSIEPGLFDIEFEWDATQQGDFQLKVWDRELFTFSARESTYEVHGRNRITIHSKWRVSPVNGTIKVRLICDRSICSYFINDGYEAGNRYLANFRPECKQALSLAGRRRNQVFKTFQVRTLRPTWQAAGK